MAITEGFFTNMKTILDETIKSFMQTTSDALITKLQPLLLTALTIYFMCKAWSIMYGRGDQQGTTMKDLTMQVIKMAFVTVLFCSTAYFYDTIADPVYKLDGFFVETISGPLGSPATNGFSVLDQVYIGMVSHAIENASNIWAAASKPVKIGVGWGSIDMPNIPAMLMGLVLMLGNFFIIFCTIFATFIAFVLLVTNTIGLCFVLAFGPLFGSFLLFPQTKQLFESWCKSCLNFVMTIVFVTAGILLMATIVNKSFGMNGVDASGSMSGLAGILNDGKEDGKDLGEYVLKSGAAVFELEIKLFFVGIIVLVFGLFIAKCPGIATSLVGGMEMGSGAAAQRLNETTNKAMSQKGLSTIANKMNAAVPAAGGVIGKALGATVGKVGWIISALRGK